MEIVERDLSIIATIKLSVEKQDYDSTQDERVLKFSLHEVAVIHLLAEVCKQELRNFKPKVSTALIRVLFLLIAMAVVDVHL